MGILWNICSDKSQSFAKRIRLEAEDGSRETYNNIDVILKDPNSIIFTYMDIDGEHKVFYKGKYILTCE